MGTFINFLSLPITLDSAARFSQNLNTRASSCGDREVWLKSFNFKLFFALKIIIINSTPQLETDHFFPLGAELAFHLEHSVWQPLLSFTTL